MGALLGLPFSRHPFGAWRRAHGHFSRWRWTYVARVSCSRSLRRRPVVPSMPAKTRLGLRPTAALALRVLADNATLRRASAIQFLLAILYGVLATVAPMMLALTARAGADRSVLAIPGRGDLVSQPAGPVDRRGLSHRHGRRVLVSPLTWRRVRPTWVGAVIAGGGAARLRARSALVANQTLSPRRAGRAQPLQHGVWRAHLGRDRGEPFSRAPARALGWLAVLRHRGERVWVALFMQGLRPPSP